MSGKTVAAHLLLSSVSLLVLSAPALAQTAAPSSGGGIEDIVVTATRREERVQNIPVAVTAMTGDNLRNAGIPTVRELTYAVPGYVGGRNFGQFQPFIRGVGSTGVTVPDEPSVSTYVDGIYQPIAGAANVDLVEVERVEVLRGPQGTTFGRNATGGLINVITPDPSFDMRGHVDVRGGVLDTGRTTAPDLDFRAYLTGGLTDKLAADFAVMWRRQGGYVKNLVGSNNFGDIDSHDIRVKLMFVPGDRSKIVLTGERFHQETEVNAPAPINGNALGRSYGGVIATRPWEVALDIAPILDSTRYNAALQMHFEFDGATLETSTGYLHDDTRQDSDSDATNIRLGTLLTAPYGRIGTGVSQEIRLLSNSGGRLNWIAGAYAFLLDSHNGTYLSSAVFGPAPSFPIRGETVTISKMWNKTHSYAGFAEGTWEFVDNLFLTLGGRYSWEKREQRTYLNVNGVETNIPNADQTFDKFTYNISLRYQFSEKSNVYVRYGTGFKSGVYTGTLKPVMTRPEQIKALEGGIKSDPVDWLRVNLSAFYYDYTDLQVTARDPLTTSYIVQNAANAELYGGELEMTLAPVQDLTVRGSVAYNHARYKDFTLAQTFIPNSRGGNTVATNDVSGNHMLRAPSWTFSISPTWETDLGSGRFGATANLFYSSRVYQDFMNLFSQKPYTMLSGELSWTTENGDWRFSVWGQNLLNKAVVQQMRVGAYSTDGIYEPPRRFGVGASRRF